MVTKESMGPRSPKEVGQLNISLLPPTTTIYKDFVFKTPRKVPLDTLHNKSPIMVNISLRVILVYDVCS